MKRLLQRLGDAFLLRRIPHVIHQIWHNEKVPSEFDRFRSSLLINHPQWGYKFWTFRDGIDLIAKHYPELLSAYYQLPKDVQRADMLRYIILHFEGGVYMDMDVESVKPLDALVWTSDFIAGYERKSYPSLCNAILMSAPRHPILSAMLNYIKNSPRDTTRADFQNVTHVFATTGSLAFTPIALATKTRRTAFVPSQVLYPFSWSEKAKCNEVFASAFTKHYWVSGWYVEGKYQICNYWDHPEILYTKECPYVM